MYRQSDPHPDLVDYIRKVLEEIGLAPEFLKIEITESALMDNTEKAAEIIAQLKAMNIKLTSTTLEQATHRYRTFTDSPSTP